MGRARHFLKNSRVSIVKKSLGEHKSKKVITLASSRQQPRATNFLSKLCDAFRATAQIAKTGVSCGLVFRRSLYDEVAGCGQGRDGP